MPAPIPDKAAKIGPSDRLPPSGQSRSVATAIPVASDDDSADLALVAAARKGDQAAWSSIIRKHQDRLFSTCMRMVRDRDLATDLTQDAFIKIMQGIDSFDGRSRFVTWMTRVTMNVCLSKLRSEKLRRHASLEAITAGRGGSGGGGELLRSGTESAGFGSLGGELGPAQSVQAKEEQDRVLRALAALDPDQRAVLILCDCRGLPYEQIAEVMGVAVGTIKSRVFRARTALRDGVEALERSGG